MIQGGETAMEKEQRFDVIQYLVKSLNRAGKIKIQKVMYFLQEAVGVPLGYEYVMYYYGPYSSQLDDTLSEMQGRGILNIMAFAHSGGWQGFDITLGKNADEAPQLPLEYKDEVERVVSFFNTIDDVKDMELCATIHFVQAILTEKGRPADKESVVNETHKLKPKFDQQTISEWYDRLEREGLLS